MLLRPSAGAIIPPWSKPIEDLAPEETETPDPTSFPDDILAYLSTTHDDALHLYREDLTTHVTKEMLDSCPEINGLTPEFNARTSVNAFTALRRI